LSEIGPTASERGDFQPHLKKEIYIFCIWDKQNKYSNSEEYWDESIVLTVALIGLQVND